MPLHVLSTILKDVKCVEVKSSKFNKHQKALDLSSVFWFYVIKSIDPTIRPPYSSLSPDFHQKIRNPKSQNTQDKR